LDLLKSPDPTKKKKSSVILKTYFIVSERMNASSKEYETVEKDRYWGHLDHVSHSVLDK
jgi:hypothetical protein